MTTEFFVATAAALFFSAAAPVALAQAPQGGPAPAAVPDPAFEAAKRAFDALPETERRAVQEALVWTGDFNGVIGGAFGRATRAAMIAFARRSGLLVDGTLDQKGREALFAAGNLAKTRVGFAPVKDPRTGAVVGLPLKILVARKDIPGGSRWSAADEAVSLETMQLRESDGDLQSVFDKFKDSTPARRVAYKFFRPDFFVISGEAGKNTFYMRVARGSANGAGALRGYTFAYPSSAKGNDRVAIAIANAFEPFPGAAPAVAAAPSPAGAQPPARPPAQAAPSAPPAPRPVVVASAVAVTAERALTALARCIDPKIGGRPARIVKQDEASGLMLLEAQGLNARPLAPAAAPAPGAQVVVLYQAARAAAPGPAATPAADAMAASGEVLGPPAPGKAARVLAPLQEQAAGGAVFDRNGALAALVGAAKPPVRVAGIVPQTAWPLIEAATLTTFLAANGVAPKPAAAPGTPQSAADIAAATRGALYPVICTQ